MTISDFAIGDSQVAKLPEDQVRQALTDDYSTKRFQIEYGSYFSNHLLHAVVALHELGADEQKITEYAAHYSEKLEVEDANHEDVLERSDAVIILTDDEALALLGKRQEFDALLAYYAQDVKKLGVDGAVRKHLPLLFGGLAGALLHGLIQLGYAYHIGGERLVAEGLAYQHHCYLPFDEPELPLPEEPLRQLSRKESYQVAAAVTTNAFLISEQDRLVSTAPVKDLDIGWIQRGVNALSGHPERGSRAAFELIWKQINQYDFTCFSGRHALDLILWLYVMVKHNDFIVLHAATSAWSLQQLEHLLSPTDRSKAWKVWLHVSLSALVTGRVKDFHEEDICLPSEGVQSRLAALPSWSQIRAQALDIPGFPDEHVYKLVQVADAHANYQDKEIEADNQTPILSQVERDFVARTAALKAIDVPFAPYSEQPK